MGGSLPSRPPRARLQAGRPDTAGSELLEWLQGEGAEVSELLEVRQDPVLGRELVVREAVDEEEELVKVTPELCIPVEEEGDTSMTEDVRLALILLQEVAEAGQWEAYRSTWPSEDFLREVMPVFWQSSRFADYPTMPRLQAQVHARREMLSQVSEKEKVDLERLLWAHALVSTRAIGASIDACALIPGVDLANHSPEPNADLTVAGLPGLRSGRATVVGHGKIWEHGSAGLVTRRPLAAGEAVRISYGKYPNQRFLLDYGFSLGEANPRGDEEKVDLA